MQDFFIHLPPIYLTSGFAIGMKSVPVSFLSVFPPNQSVFKNQELPPTDEWRKAFGSVMIKAFQSGQFRQFADLGC